MHLVQQISKAQSQNTGGRPEIIIDWELVDKYIIQGYKGVQIAKMMRISYDTLLHKTKKKYGKTFTAYKRDIINDNGNDNPILDIRDITLDWERFDELAEAHCSPLEIASVFGLTIAQLAKVCARDKGMLLDQYYYIKLSVGKAKIKQKASKMAMEGNTKILLHLCKHYLGQADKVEQVVTLYDPGVQKLITELKRRNELLRELVIAAMNSLPQEQKEKLWFEYEPKLIEVEKDFNSNTTP